MHPSADQVAAILHRLTSHSGLILLEWKHDVPSISEQGAAVLMQALEANVAMRFSCCDANDDWSFSATRALNFRMKPQPKETQSSFHYLESSHASLGKTSFRSGPSLLFVAACQVIGQTMLRTYDIVGDELTVSIGLMVLLSLGLRLLFPSVQRKTT